MDTPKYSESYFIICIRVFCCTMRRNRINDRENRETECSKKFKIYSLQPAFVHLFIMRRILINLGKNYPGSRIDPGAGSKIFKTLFHDLYLHISLYNALINDKLIVQLVYFKIFKLFSLLSLSSLYCICMFSYVTRRI